MAESATGLTEKEPAASDNCLLRHARLMHKKKQQLATTEKATSRLSRSVPFLKKINVNRCAGFYKIHIFREFGQTIGFGKSNEVK